MNTSGYIMQGKANPDGHIVIEPTEYAFASGAPTVVRSGLGLINLLVAASGTTVVDYDIANILFRYGMQDDSQMLFGQNNGTGGAQALPLLPGTVFNTPYSTQARPPITASQYFGSNTGNATVIPKGITVRAINLAYQVLGAGLTSATIGLTKTQYAPGPAIPVVTNLLAAVNNGILLPIAANPITVNIPIAAANQVMLNSRLAKYLLELTFVAPAGSTVQVSGIFLDVAYNYN